MLDKIKALLQEVENMKAANAEELEALRIKYLSKKGEISALMNDFRNVAADQKRDPSSPSERAGRFASVTGMAIEAAEGTRVTAR